jgi:hypothetical protein
VNDTVPASARTGHVAYAMAPAEALICVMQLGVSMLGAYFAAEHHEERELANVLDLEKLCSGLHGIASVAARNEVPAHIQEDEFGVTSLLTGSALVPLPGGAVHIDVTVICSSDASDFDAMASIAIPLAAQVLWMAVGAVDVDSVLAKLPDWFASIGMPIDEDEEEPPELPDCLVSEALDAVHDRVAYRDGVIERMHASTQAQAVRAAAEAHRRTERQLTRHVSQLQTELETQRAVTQRQRDRADAAERSLRSASSSTATARPAGLAAGVSAADPRDAALDQLRLVSRQQAEELDRLRAEAFRLREDLDRRDSAPAIQAPRLPEQLHPANLHGLASWAQASLGGRVMVHVKAARAARKSGFADPGLVYRVLEAMATHYWSMRFRGDVAGRAAWEAFLAKEHLTCGPTGAAVNDHRTRAAYLVDWQRRTVELDQHLQGNSSRDEARSFRVYFHVDLERQVIVIGHLPSHLPNSHT